MYPLWSVSAVPNRKQKSRTSAPPVGQPGNERAALLWRGGARHRRRGKSVGQRCLDAKLRKTSTGCKSAPKICHTKCRSAQWCCFI